MVPKDAERLGGILVEDRMNRDEESTPESRQDPLPPAEEEGAQPALPETEPGTEDDSQPDLLVWGLLALVILGGLVWLFLARRPAVPTATAVSGGSSRPVDPTPMAPSPTAPTPASTPSSSPEHPLDEPPPGSGPPGVPPGSGPAHVPPGSGGSGAAGAPGPSPTAAVAPPALSIPPAAPSGVGGLPVMYVGAEPTTDPASWTFVHGDLLLGALREVDSAPSTAFTPDQLKALEKVLDEVTPPARELNSVSLELVHLVQGALDPRQLAAMAAVEETLALQSPDLQALLEALGRLAGSAAGKPASTVDPQETQAIYPASFLVAGLAYLKDFQKAPLRPEQAARFLPKLQAYSRALQAQTAHYPKLIALMTPGQAQAFRKALAEMRVSRNPPLAERQMTLAEMQLYLDKRLAR